MGIYELLITLCIGAISGCLASLLLKNRSVGLKYDIMIGVVGALMSTHVLALLNIHITSLLGSVAASTLGASILLFLLSLLDNQAKD